MKSSLENLVWTRAKRRCEYCQIEQTFDELTFEIDHIIARRHRGKTTAANLALACLPCNKSKSCDLSGIDPLTKRTVRLFHPRRMKWSRHFRWDGPWVEIQILSAEQDAAVVALLREIHVPGERVEHGYRIFGYVRDGVAVDYV